MMSSLLRKLHLSLRRRFFGRGKPHTEEYWDTGFPAGRWAYLDSKAESLRFEALALLVTKHHGSGTILDVGCGTGTLSRYLSPLQRQSYVGTDLSGEALNQARHACAANTVFLHEPAEARASGSSPIYEPFGIIVLSEILYYIDNPFKLIRQYRTRLSAEGVFIISLWNPQRHAVLR